MIKDRSKENGDSKKNSLKEPDKKKNDKKINSNSSQRKCNETPNA